MRQEVLYELLKDKKGIVGVEIGVASGQSAQGFLTALDIKNLYLVDPFEKYYDATQGDGLVGKDFNEAYPEAYQRLKDYPVAWILRKSEEAVKQIFDESLDFVYIDGDHQYEYVKKDIEAWTKKVKKGGVVSGHDFTIGDITKAVEEYVEKNNYVLSTDTDKVEWWFIKE